MTLLEFHADLGRVANALERIVFLLEKLVTEPPPRDVRVHQATEEDLHIVTPEDVERIAAEQARFAELRRVVPGSEAYADVLFQWEADQRRIHGQAWKAPDWASTIYAAQGGGDPVREPARDPAAAGDRS